MKDEGPDRSGPLHPSSFRLHPFLKVRIALHTGQAEQRDGDYFGAALIKREN